MTQALNAHINNKRKKILILHVQFLLYKRSFGCFLIIHVEDMDPDK
jgi:hypothetical protein